MRHPQVKLSIRKSDPPSASHMEQPQYILKSYRASGCHPPTYLWRLQGICIIRKSYQASAYHPQAKPSIRPPCLSSGSLIYHPQLKSSIRTPSASLIYDPQVNPSTHPPCLWHSRVTHTIHKSYLPSASHIKHPHTLSTIRTSYVALTRVFACHAYHPQVLSSIRAPTNSHTYHPHVLSRTSKIINPDYDRKDKEYGGRRYKQVKDKKVLSSPSHKK